LKCPNDGNVLIAGNAEDHTGYGCSACKGSWLPRKYIDSIKYSKDFDVDKFFLDLSTDNSGCTNLPCPSNCGFLNTIANIDSINYCPVCKGVWFEKDALKNMLKRYPDKESALSGVDTSNLTVGIFDILGSLFK
jgi:Zn-finger nucleic acid-binding protein